MDPRRGIQSCKVAISTEYNENYYARLHNPPYLTSDFLSRNKILRTHNQELKGT